MDVSMPIQAAYMVLHSVCFDHAIHKELDAIWNECGSMIQSGVFFGWACYLRIVMMSKLAGELQNMKVLKRCNETES